MLKVLKKRVYPIGVDLGSGHLRMAQLGSDGEQLYLHAAACEVIPPGIRAGSPDWQRWAAEMIRQMAREGGFKGRKAISALPSHAVFIEQVRIPKLPEKKASQAALDKIAKRLPFPATEAAIKHITLAYPSSNGELDVLVMATQQRQIDYHLAIHETAGLETAGISVWPQAMVNSYVRFFSRRAEDAETISLLIDIGSNHTNIVICRQTDLYFARMVPMGFNQLRTETAIDQWGGEIDACCRYYDAAGPGQRIGRLMFLSGLGIDKPICDRIAKLAQRMQVPAQMGDVLSAVERRPGLDELVDKRDNRINWTTAFGLSLAAEG